MCGAKKVHFNEEPIVLAGRDAEMQIGIPKTTGIGFLIAI